MVAVGAEDELNFEMVPKNRDFAFFARTGWLLVGLPLTVNLLSFSSLATFRCLGFDEVVSSGVAVGET